MVYACCLPAIKRYTRGWSMMWRQPTMPSRPTQHVALPPRMYALPLQVNIKKHVNRLMAAYTVIFTPEAQHQLLALYRYIAQRGAPLTAQRYTDAIVSTCEALASFPMRGVSRDDIRPGLRLTHHKKNTAIAFTVTGQTVTIIGVFYGGQNISTTVT